MRSSITLASLLAGLSLVGCGGGYEVEVHFDPEALADDGAAVEIALVPSCAAQTLGAPASGALTVVTAHRMGGVERLGDVAPGDYGLYARAMSADCEVIAAGCEPVSLAAGGEGVLVVTVSAIAGPGCTAGTVCEAGECVRSDGGMGECPGGCDDGDACTTDVCVAAACVSSTRDLDGDGHGDEACPVVGGVPNDDCDDSSPVAYADATELCNGEDDDCDGSSDEDFDCVRGVDEPCASCGQEAVRSCGATCTLGSCTPTPDTAMVALYTFDDEPTTGGFSDASGAHPGTMADGVAVWTEGPMGCGEALLVSGAGEYGEVADSVDWDLATGTLEAWVRFDVADQTAGVIGRDASGTALPGHLTLGRLDTNVLEARIQNLDGEITRCTLAAVPTGAWLDVEIHFGPPDFELVVDGVRATGCDVGTNVLGIDGNDNPWVFGAHTYTSDEGSATPILDPMAGALDHIRIRSTRGDPAAPEVTGFVLVDADADVNLGPLVDGAVLDLASLPAICVRARTDPGEVDMVVFDLDATSGYHTEGIPPYMIVGDSTGDYAPWDPGPGTYTIQATAYAADGTPGAPRAITVTLR